MFSSMYLQKQFGFIYSAVSANLFTRTAYKYKNQSNTWCRAQLSRTMSSTSDHGISYTSSDDDFAKSILSHCRNLAPPLRGRHKGQAGRIAVIGGSIEYTGAPYFAAITAMRVGADLVHVFCPKDAASVIKTYSPDLIVHPLLDSANSLEDIKRWLGNMSAVVLGPGLGRDPATFAVTERLIAECKRTGKPLVVDADGLFLFTQRPMSFMQGFTAPIILTPNLVEYARLLQLDFIGGERSRLFDAFGPNLVLCVKGESDELFTTGGGYVFVAGGGSGRRCGGQGDLLSGSLGVFLNWALSNTDRIEGGLTEQQRCLVAGAAATTLVRECNRRAFAKARRAMTASDMLVEISGVFNELFEKYDENV